MAVVLDALAARVMNTIMDMGEDKIRMLLGVSKEINKLQGNVEPLRNLLTDAERRRITDKTVQAWVTKLKNAMYEAQDILDLCQLEAMDRQDKQHSSGLCFRLREKLPFLGCLGDKLQGILQPFLFCVQNPGFANEVGSRIKNLNDELINIRNGGAGFNFSIDLGSYKERGRPLTSSAHPRRENAQFIESDLVGDQIKKNAEDLVQKLITDHDSSSSAIKVVSIVGMGGIGKSTLAKKVLAIETIKEEFEIKIWLSVTQQFAAVDLLRTAISQAGGKPGEEKDETILAQALTDVLSKRKFLLILDDVWTVEAWDRMLRVPVLKAGCEQPRSRVLVTTRMEDIVRSMGASIVRVNRLNDEDAWCLLKKQLPLPQVGVESDFNDLKDIGMKIVKKCDGLPLAIKVMGGLLSTRYPNEREWEIILHKNIGWQEDRSQDELNYSVSLSYDDLSPVLKQCFLYYSLLPKGSGFAENRVISMWISEGFVQHSGRLEPDQLDLQEIGDEYHRELVARNLLEPDDTNNNIWEYTLHDVVRLFAQYMAKEEAFVVHKDQADIRNLLLGNKKVCRLSVKLTHSELEWTILEKQERVRTLLLIDCKIKPGGSLANFANLRVLDISSEESDWLVDTLGNLRHLRYLSLSKTNISRLPDDIHKMRFLEHIELNCCKKLEKLPSNITKLACLRYLNLNGSNVHVIPRGFGGLTNLRFVGGFPAKMDGDWCTLQELEALSHLRRLSVISLENVPRSSVAKRARIGNKKNLEYLDLSCYKDDEEEEDEVREIGVEQQERIEAVFDELCPPPKLETLQIGGYFGRRLPNWLQSPVATTFKSLKHIGLNHITYCTRLPDGLCRDGGVAFPNLRIIELDTLTLLEYVENFPSVVELKVYSCPELKRICGLSKLRTLDINNCPKLKLLEGVPVLDSLELDWEHWRSLDQMPGAHPRDIKPKTKCHMSSQKTLS